MARLRLRLRRLFTLAALAVIIGTATTCNAFAAVGARSLRMGGSSGVATTRAGKDATIAKLNGLLQESSMIFSIPTSSIAGGKVTNLRKSMPENVTARVVKNTLMSRAVAGTQFECINEAGFSKGENMWFFCTDESMTETIKYVEAWAKESGGKLAETHKPKYGVMEGQPLDQAGVEAVASLPSKKDLYQKIAGSINMVPTKLAKGLKQVPTKLARGVKLAKCPDDAEA
jgi:large subunit ribosomal protein L10